MSKFNDMQASELVSKSLSGVLSDEEKRDLEEYMTESEEAKSYASLSSMIHKSVNEFGANLDSSGDELLEGLSQVAKERLKRSVRKAKRDSFAMNAANSTQDQALSVAEKATAYYTRDELDSKPSYSTSTDEVDDTEQNRHAVARFTLLQKIGEGGLGSVWLARDERLKRNVALKEMTEAAATSKKVAQRFQREAEITAQLEHPHVVPLYLSGVNPDSGLPFYAMRFLGKRTLEEAIHEYHARRKVHADESVDLLRLLNAFLDVCQAIAFAHSRGVIHRDLKPENVALDSFGQVLVLDWGLAKLDSEGELCTRLALSGTESVSHLGNTLEGDVVGTPLYMAPEQAAGKLDDVDSRTDVYGLGGILFSILTGEAPHASTKTEGTVRQFLDSISTADAPSLTEINPDVPRDLANICQRALAKEKFARYSSASELAAEVENWIAGKRDKEARFDAMYMSARDLKSRLCVQIRQLIATTQFMVELPPIQGLLRNVDGDKEEFATWRVRLAQILQALAKTKPTVSGLSFSRVDKEKIEEFVRVERSLMDVANVRNLPQSRLRKGIASTFHQIVLQQFPGECAIDFDCTTAGTVRLVCGIPVFDDETEEPFGIVCTEAEIGNFVRPELDMIGQRDRIYLIDDNESVLFASARELEAKQTPIEELIPVWSELKKSLQESGEYRDPNREFYATKMQLPQKYNSLSIVVQLAD